MSAAIPLSEPLLPTDHEVTGLICQVLDQADKPLNVKQILESIPKQARPEADAFEKQLKLELRAGRVFECGRLRGQVCYSIRPQVELARIAIEGGLQIARSRSEILGLVSKLAHLKGFPKASLASLFQSLVDEGKVVKWPSYLGSRSSLFCMHAPDHSIYIKHAINQLAKRFQIDESNFLDAAVLAINESRMIKRPVNLDEAPASNREVPKGLFGVRRPAANNVAKNRAAANNVAKNRAAADNGNEEMTRGAETKIGDCLFEALRDINPRFDQGDIVSVAELRNRLDFKIDKGTFDHELIQLAVQSRVSLHPFDRPGLTAPEELEQFVADGAGQYFNAVSVRRKR